MPIFQCGVDLVNLGLTITGTNGVLFTDLKVDDFEIYEGDKQQKILNCSTGDPVSVDHRGPEMPLGLLLDISQGMGEDIGFTKTVSIKFLNTLIDAVDVTLVDFDT